MQELPVNTSSELPMAGMTDHDLPMFEAFGTAGSDHMQTHTPAVLTVESSMHDGIDNTIFDLVPTHTGGIETGVVHNMELLDNAVADGLGDFNMGTGMMAAALPAAAWDELGGLAQAVGTLPPWDESAFEQFMVEINSYN